MISSKHISKITIFSISLCLLLCVLAMVFSDKLTFIATDSRYSMEYQDKLFNVDSILDIDIIMEEESWSEMLKNALSEDYYRCDVTINGTTFYGVAIRPKGNTSLSSIANNSNSNRYSFKLEFDHFAPGQTCFGLDKLILNNNYADKSNIKEAIVYDMFSYLDAKSSLYNFAKISVNSKYWGVYLALEAVEESFMLRNFGNEKGYLYKPDGMNHNNGDKNNEMGGFRGEKFRVPQNPNGQSPNLFADDENEQKPALPPEFDENNPTVQKEGMIGGPGRFGGGVGGGNGANLNYIDDDPKSYSAIWNGEVNDSSDSDHLRVIAALKNISQKTNIENYIDVDSILKYMAVHNFSVNEDSLSGNMAHNYYLYEANGKISVLPWDYNLAFGAMRSASATNVVNDPIDDPYSSTDLFDFILENEEYKARYHEYYKRLIEEYFYGGKFDETYKRIKSQINELVKNDPNALFSYEEYEKATDSLYQLIILRAQSVRGQIAGTIPSTSEAQREDSSSLVSAEHISISDVGEFMGGGRPQDRSNRDFNAQKEPTT